MQFRNGINESSASFRGEKKSTSFRGYKIKPIAVAKEADIPRNIVC